ncbi:protein-disulfide reductase DsbD [Legionella taurinensis]|uniref:Protein-disulfide reductase DsbD n=1 Tax=Legionella taurinensis TaxID=70611 RepID=A0A3A5LJ21_9GAMM|nr:protein-disulfide reductase DsbD [Legionella taurinensis]RJT47957.1 protein-disulfide reductase DsbD [Legionella taurinensis]RJT68171.1 protein-disulfide reductase DsbD [Legionella taurinensis]STY25653.1 thiol:disulfide interchange protein DsbD [Legionella taurinensis]
MNLWKGFRFLALLMFVSKSAWSFSGELGSANPAMIMHFIEHHNALIYLSAFFGLGLLLSFTPCVLPMIPILSGILVGRDSLSTPQAFKLSLSYVIGMAATYAAAGVMAGYLGSTLQTAMQQPAVILSFSALFVMMGLSMSGLFELRLPQALQHRFKQRGKPGYAGAMLMGIASTLVVSPCVTAPLIGVLTYISQKGEPAQGGLILLVMAAGMGMPLLLVGSGYGSLLPKTGGWMLKIKKCFALVLFAMAIWMASRILPAPIITLLWASLFVFGSIFLGSLQSTTHKGAVWFKGMGVASIMAGGMLAHAALLPLIAPAALQKQHAVKQTVFVAADSMAAIEKRLNDARRQHKPALLVFTASWCSACQALESRVLNQPQLRSSLDGLLRLKIDISQSNPTTDEIKQAFAIYGTPTLLFIDREGQVVDDLSAVGFINQQALSDRIHRLKQG